MRAAGRSRTSDASLFRIVRRPVERIASKPAEDPQKPEFVGRSRDDPTAAYAATLRPLPVVITVLTEHLGGVQKAVEEAAWSWRRCGARATQGRPVSTHLETEDLREPCRPDHQ